jgi:4-hydroxy-tetrahydrodipicolinate synthase
MPDLGGVYTALVTPTVDRGAVDWRAFDRLLDFQASAGVAGVVVGGTTGESPTLTPEELIALTARSRERLPSRVEVIPATARNHLAETLALTRAVVDLGVSNVLLVDPYYNAPSSWEIRLEHLQPVAAAFPGLGLVPYVIPSRTGTRLEPVDVEWLAREGVRITGLKDATADPEYARALRRRCPSLPLLSGDDGRTLAMILDPTIRAAGVVSVVSNLAPAAMVRLVRAAREGDEAGAERLAADLRALFDTVTIQVTERTPQGEEVAVRSRNPVPVKTALGLLGVPVGRCRPPLGRLTPRGLARLVTALEAARDTPSRPLDDLAALVDPAEGDRATAGSDPTEFAYAEQ